MLDDRKIVEKETSNVLGKGEVQWVDGKNCKRREISIGRVGR